MKSNLLLASFRHGWRFWAAWSVSIMAIASLGAFRSATDAEFALGSLALFPVLFVAWIGGRRNGVLIAILAAAMWGVSDIASDRQFSASWVPWANAVTRLITYSLVAVLAAQVRLHLEAEHELATQDMLTGLQNKRAFLEAGVGEVERSKRYAHPLAIVFLDLDDFKQLNDTRGHDVGDAALRATAKALRSALRSSDRLARLGGDEFAAFLPEIGYAAAIEAGKKISLAVHGALMEFPPARVSVGVAWFEKADRTFDAMLKAADQLMYEVKGEGKGDMRSRRYPALSQNGLVDKQGGADVKLPPRAPGDGRQTPA